MDEFVFLTYFNVRRRLKYYNENRYRIEMDFKNDVTRKKVTRNRFRK